MLSPCGGVLGGVGDLYFMGFLIACIIVFIYSMGARGQDRNVTVVAATSIWSLLWRRHPCCTLVPASAG